MSTLKSKPKKYRLISKDGLHIKNTVTICQKLGYLDIDLLLPQDKNGGFWFIDYDEETDTCYTYSAELRHMVNATFEV